MSLTRRQNKKVKHNARSSRSSEAVTSPTNSEQGEHDIDSHDDIEILDSDIAKKINTTNKKRTRAAREPTSFVWGYFKRGEDLVSAICKVIKDDNGEECGHHYNDGSTTSNLIHHLATKHNIFKPGSAEEVILFIIHFHRVTFLIFFIKF